MPKRYLSNNKVVLTIISCPEGGGNIAVNEYEFNLTETERKQIYNSILENRLLII